MAGTTKAGSEADEKQFLDAIVEPEHTVTRDIGFGPVTSVVRGNEEWAACTLDVYEQYYPTYHDYADSSEDSPTLFEADAAAQRKCARD